MSNVVGISRVVLGEIAFGITRKFTGISGDKILDTVVARRDNIDKLRKALAKLVAQGGACRPTFARDLLERIKHVLNVPGVVFVFGVNLAALRETIRAAYGAIDAHQYLLRIFTATLEMPSGATFRETGVRSYRMRQYLRDLANKYGLIRFCEQH